jgi:hypothetical protein
MERSLEITENTAERGSSNIFSLAVTVGFITFLITGDLPGGLTGTQGFFAGFFAVMFLYVALTVLQSRRSEHYELSKIRLNAPANISITQTENEKGVTIQIYVSKASVLSQGMGNDR